jgi:hypothetical protein
MALSADARITLLRVKIERAKHHLRDLERELLPLRGKYHYGYLPQLDSNSGKVYQKWSQIPLYTFDVLSIAGDVVHSLRSALDHLAYQLAIAGEGLTPSRQVEFPIAKDRDTYESEKARKVKGIRPEAIERIDGLHPYKGGNEVLWRIHQLDNVDKHRFIFTVGVDALFTAPWYPETADRVGFLLRPRTLKTDSPLFSSAFDDEVDNYVNFDIAEAVSDPKVGQGNALLPSLVQWVDYIEGVILGFEPFLVSDK